jgi:spore coat protein H
MLRTSLLGVGLLLASGACGGATASDAPDVDATIQPDAAGAEPDAAAALRCEPAVDGPYWLEEGEPLEVTLRCDGALAAGDAALTIDDLPVGATLDGTTLTWTPALDQAAVWQLPVRAAATGESTLLVIGVADAYDTPGNVPVVDPTAYTHEFGLPVFFLTWHSEDPNYCLDNVTRDHVPADITALGHVYTGATLRCRGAASLNMPKKSFTLDFGPGDRFAATPGLDRFDGRHSLVLTQTFDDASYLRTRLAFEMWNRLAPDAVQLQTASAVVFIDGQYWGMYQLTDHVDDDLLDDQGFDGAAVMYKAYSHDGNVRAEYNNGSPKGNLAVGYEQKEGFATVTDFSDLGALLTWVTSSSDIDFADQLDAKVVSADFVRWYVFATAIIAQDSYGKNSYLWHATTGDDQRWRTAPWDMNHALGQNWQSFRIGPTDEGRFANWPTTTNGIWRRMAAQPELAGQIDAAFADALTGPMSKAAVTELLDAMIEEIEVPARRDYRKWGTQMETFPWWSGRSDINDGDGERAYVRQWISDRWDYLDTLY